MENLEDFNEHLKTISLNDWVKLFELLPEFEKTERFGELVFNQKDGIFNFPYYDSSDIVTRFVKVSYELKIIPAFDWMNWEEGKEVLQSYNNEYFEKYDIITLCKFIGTIIRADSFYEGYLVSNFENRTIQKILQSLKNKIVNKVN